MTWESRNKDKKKNVSKGVQKILSINNNGFIIELKLIEPMPAVCKLEHLFASKNNNQKLYTCIFHATASFPRNILSYLIGRKFIIKNQQKTLQNAQSILEL